ncbi:MAG TPA: hypothetical protein ENN36_03190 [Candidatus Bathyarchaeota archaeon]|nr:hypothetical protein [Candidatus Bathyarchaeota archaeon]
MPRHEEFQKIYQNFIDQYGAEEGEEKYFAWLNEHGYDDTKPMPKKEGFSWAGSIKEMPGVDNLIRGQALHPLRTVHPEEWPEVREYLEEELEKSAHTLTGKPLVLDHCQVLEGKVFGAEYEDGSIEYVAQLNDPNVMELVKNGAIKHCSVEFEWKSLEQVNGVAPRGINFTGLSLLRMFQPGDQKTTVEVWEGIIKELKEAKAPPPAKPENKSADEETTIKESGEEKQVPLDAHEESPSALAETAKQAGDGESEEGKLKEQDDQEPEKDEHGCVIGKERYDEELGKCVPVEAATEKKKGLGEAILEPGDPSEPVGYVSVEKLERILPHPRQHIPWGMRTHFVDPLRRLIYEAKKEAA